MLTLTNFLNHTAAGALTLKALQSTLQGFILTDAYLRHCYPSFRSSRLDISHIDRRMANRMFIIAKERQLVNAYLQISCDFQAVNLLILD